LFAARVGGNKPDVIIYDDIEGVRRGSGVVLEVGRWLNF
jgi:hypothetical protein